MGTHPIFESDFDCLTEKMPRPMRAAKSAMDRMFDASGLTGESKKNMHLYPKLQQFPLPFPADNVDFMDKLAIMNKYAIEVNDKFRKMPAVLDETTKSTPDVERYGDVPVVRQVPYINYTRLPLELNPQRGEIRSAQRQKRRKRKFKPHTTDEVAKTVAETLEKTKQNLENNEEEMESAIEPESGEPVAKKAPEATNETDNESDDDNYENDYQQLHGFDDDEGMIDQEEDGLEDDYS